MPKLEPALLIVWQWFLELSAARGHGFSGPAPISYADIDAWMRVTATSISPREALLLVTIDRAWLGEYHRLQEAKKPKGRAHE